MNSRRHDLAGRDVISFAGWLFADSLVILAIIFLSTSVQPNPRVASAGSAQSTPTTGSRVSITATVDPQDMAPNPVCLTIHAHADALLGLEGSAAQLQEETRGVDPSIRQVVDALAGRHVAVVMSFGTSPRPDEGKRLAQLVNQEVHRVGSDSFSHAGFVAFHNLDNGDNARGTVYVYIFPYGAEPADLATCSLPG